MDWMARERLQEMAAEQAEAILERLSLRTTPIDPLEVAGSEAKLLEAIGGDFRSRFDGQIEYHRKRNKFLLFFNTKYDAGLDPGEHHPRTRFSIAHELGHYFLEKHHAYLVKGGWTHPSRSEFFSQATVEREADAFAASLLMPSRLMRPLVNSEELSPSRLDQISRQFKTSLVGTAIRSVRLSDFPCALVGIRDGQVAWSFLSESLKKRGCYPAESGSAPHELAGEAWREFTEGVTAKREGEGRVGRWFRTYEDEDLQEIPVTEHYLPVPVMKTLLVLLAASEDDLFAEVEEESDED